MYPSLPSSFLRLKGIFPSSLEINGFFSSFVTSIASVILKPFVSQIEWTHQLSTCLLKLPLGCKEDKNLLHSICKFGSNLRQNTDRECLQRTKISLQFSGWYTSFGSFFSLYHRSHCFFFFPSFTEVTLDKLRATFFHLVNFALIAPTYRS